jgi:BolA family transcriptional regulator, general stress-responsive regulator
MNGAEKVVLITQRLQDAFLPTQLEVLDESAAHAGHAGHQGGGRHFAIIIAAESLRELSRVEAHRRVYALFGDLMPNEIHALRIQVL